MGAGWGGGAGGILDGLGEGGGWVAVGWGWVCEDGWGCFCVNQRGLGREGENDATSRRQHCVTRQPSSALLGDSQTDEYWS